MILFVVALKRFYRADVSCSLDWVHMGKGYILLALLLCALPLRVLPASPRNATGGIHWDLRGEKVDAQIERWPLAKVLEGIATSTGWQVYVEPDSRQIVSTRFRDLEPAEALRRLLGELNFALLPQTNAPSKLFVYRTTVHGATQLVPSAIKPKAKDASAKPIPNELILRLKPGAKQSIEELAKRLGAKVVGRIDELNAYRLQFEDEEAAQKARAQLDSDEDVSSVQDNFSVAAPGQLQPLANNFSPPPSFKLNQANSSDKLIIALVDTAFQSRGAPWADYLVSSLSLAGGADLDPARLTHGTAMLDTLWAELGRTLTDPASASVGFLSIDVYGNNSSTTMFDVAQAIMEAVAKGARIINLSLGGEGDSPLLREVLSQSHAQGVQLVASAGNTPDTNPTMPAADSNVLSVTAGAKDGTLAPYANRSDTVDLVAPGTSLVFFQGQAYLVTGTSPAAANVTGAIAGLSINNHKIPTEVSSQVIKLPGFNPVTKR
jgi:hypothetical protein